MEIFADSIHQFHYIGGMVRIDFSTVQPEGMTDFSGEYRLILPLEGFLGLAGEMQKMRTLLEAQNGMKRPFTGKIDD